MPIPLGVLAVAGAGAAGAAGAYEWLETQVLGTAAASVTFSNVDTNYASTYQHLQLRVVARTDRANALDRLDILLNGDTGTNYSAHELQGSGSLVQSAGYANLARAESGYISGGNNTASSFGVSIIDILDAFETTKYTTMRALSGVTGSATYIVLFSSSWRNTAAVNEIKLDNISSNFAIGSRFSLYGLRSS